MNIKYNVAVLLALVAIVFGGTSIFASEEDMPPEPPQSIAITPNLYPSSIKETTEGDTRIIMKIYELSEGENPADIPIGDFERSEYKFQLTDIIKNQSSMEDKKEFVKPVEINTSSKEISAIIKELQPTIEYKSEDGYYGVLELNIESITCDVAGYKSSTYQVTATREYPHLSSNDTSLIPKTIQDNGKTMTLDKVTWSSQNNETIDYEAIPESYKATATYVTTASSSKATGYVTKAEYKGIISKTTQGKAVYIACFEGVPIKPKEPLKPIIPIVKPEPPKEKVNILPFAIGGFVVLASSTGFLFFLFTRKNVKVFNQKDGKYVYIGGVKVRYKNPIIDLSSLSSKSDTGAFILVLDKYAVKKLHGQVITITYDDRSIQHIIEGESGEYQFDVAF